MIEITGDKLLSTVEAARFLKTHISSLATYRCYGGGPAFTKGRRRIHYKLSELVRFANEKGFDLSEESLP